MANPHDRFFRETFRHLDEARSLLRSALPADVSKRIQWDTLARVDRSFIDQDLVECHTDHLFTVLVAGQLVLLYVLCEHKRRVDPDSPFQLLRYEVRIWEDWRREHPTGPLPPILPYVLYHGERPWTGPRRLQDCIALDTLPADVVRFLCDLLPDAGFLLDDLAAQSDDVLEARALSAVALISVLAMRNLPGRPPEVVAAAIARWQQTIAAALRQRGPDGLLLLWSYLFETTETRPEALVAALPRPLRRRLETTMRSTAERLRQEGHAEGRAEGRVEGRAEGRVEGRAEGRVEGRAEGRVEGRAEGRVEGRAEGRVEGRVEGRAEGRVEGRVDLMLELLATRFGSVPVEVAARVRTASEGDLLRWARALPGAANLDDVFAG